MATAYRDRKTKRFTFPERRVELTGKKIETFARQMEDWLDWAWANCMKKSYYYNRKYPRGTRSICNAVGRNNQSKMRTPVQHRSRSDRGVASLDANTTIDFYHLYVDWVKKIRRFERASNHTDASRPAEFDKNGRIISGHCLVLYSEAIHEFNLLWDFMTDQGLFPPGFSPTVIDQRLRSRTTGR